MEFTKYEDELLMDKVFELEDKGLFTGVDFWERIRLKMSHDVDVLPRTWQQWKNRFDYLYSLGPSMMTYEERYFYETGRYLEDDEVPTYEEDMENDRDSETASDNDNY
jgi:hypothetical protein